MAKPLSARALSAGIFALALTGAAGMQTVQGVAQSLDQTRDQTESQASRTSAAAQLYQDARYDYSMGYIKSAISNLQLLIERHPYSAFARQGRKDLKMLYASWDRRLNGSNNRRAAALTPTPKPVPRSTSVTTHTPTTEPVTSRESFTPLQDRLADRSRAGSIEGDAPANGRENDEEDSLSRVFVAAPAKTDDAYDSSEPTGAADSVLPSQRQKYTAAISAVQAVSKASVSNVSARPLDTRAGKSGGRQDGDSATDWPAGNNPLSRSQLAVLGRSTTTTATTTTTTVPIAAASPRDIVQLAKPISPQVVVRRSAVNIRRFNAAFKSASSDRIFFGQQSSGLGDRARAVISSQARWLVEHEDLAVSIDGHADDGGSRQADEDMSRLRAQAVRDYLVSKGVDAGRIFISAHGRAKRIAICSTSDCAAQNRRVVTKVTSR